jgi:hypothetical protein
MWMDRLVTLMNGYRRATPGLEDFPSACKP